jgi:hypothetical protein
LVMNILLDRKQLHQIPKTQPLKNSFKRPFFIYYTFIFSSMPNKTETDIKKDVFFLTVNCDRINQDKINEIAGMTRNKLTKT